MKLSLSVSIGVPAYNEDNNIARLLTALLKQKTDKVKINEIIVISSGSTDGTDGIVRKFSHKDERIQLIRQNSRKGKASAINEFLKASCSQILVLESADTLPDDRTIEKLCLPFESSKIGMTGAHPVPTNSENSFMGYTSHLLWELHNEMAMRSPKCGELVAFRKVFQNIPEDTAVDEAWIEYEIKKRNLGIVYVPEAIVYNKGPETIGDFLKQRRRIACGHLDLNKRTNFLVSTDRFSCILPAVFKLIPSREIGKWFFFAGAVALEGLCRFLGSYDYHKKKNSHSVWEISKTTKSLDMHAD